MASSAKTVRLWRSRGRHGARSARAAVSQLDPFRDWLAQRAPEVRYNASVLYRELCEQGFAGSVIIVRHAVVPLRAKGIPRVATVRFEMRPGEQAKASPCTLPRRPPPKAGSPWTAPPRSAASATL